MRPQASVLKEKGQNRYVAKGNGGGISTVSLCHAPSERLEKPASVSAGRVEAVRQSQNTLTAEQSAWVSDTDCRDNTVAVETRAVPRTYAEGMTAEFLLVSDEETITVPGTMGETHAFTARLTGPLTDEITVSVAFATEGQRQTQVLE